MVERWSMRAFVYKLIRGEGDDKNVALMFGFFKMPEVPHMQKVKDPVAMPDGELALPFKDLLEFFERINFARVGHPKQSSSKTIV